MARHTEKNVLSRQPEACPKWGYLFRCERLQIDPVVDAANDGGVLQNREVGFHRDPIRHSHYCQAWNGVVPLALVRQHLAGPV